MSLIVFGSGVSVGTPDMECILGKNSENRLGGCEVCRKASKAKQGELNKNSRLCASAILRKEKDDESGAFKHILIDVCKTFREGAVQFFPEFKIPHVDAALLTHGNPDSILGIDDLRMAQKYGESLPIYLSEESFEKVVGAFDYLVQKPPNYLEGIEPSRSISQPRVTAKTFVANIEWNIVSLPSIDKEELNRTFHTSSVEFKPIPLIYGEGCLSVGYVFGKGQNKLVYLSNMENIPEITMKYLKTLCIEILVASATYRNKNLGKFVVNIERVLDIIRAIQPKNTFLTGISHDIDHEHESLKLNSLQAENLRVELAYDGQVIDLKNIDL